MAGLYDGTAGLRHGSGLHRGTVGLSSGATGLQQGGATSGPGATAPTLTRTSTAGHNPLSWTAAYTALIIGSDQITMRFRVNSGAWTNETPVLFDSNFFMDYGVDAANYPWPLFQATTFTTGQVVDVQEGILRGGVTVWSSTLTDTMAGGGASTATWDATWDDNTFTDVTGSNLIATFPSGSTGNIRSSATGTGKKVASFTVNAVGTTIAIGLCNTTFAHYDSGATNTLRYFYNNFVDLMGASQGAGWATYTTGDRIDIAFDRSNNLAWLGKNGTWVGSPTGGTGGINIAGLTGALYFWAQGNGSAQVTFDPNHTALGTLTGFTEI